MKTYTKYLLFKTKRRMEFINITREVQDAIEESNIKEGLCHVNAMHITSGVYINDAEDGLIQDIQEWLERIAPSGLDYKHHLTGEDNGDAHLKRMIVGHEVTIPITNGKADFGPWEQIYYAEFDGKREKRVIIKIIGL
jgi:secondary thiamine-phosphate synthase enzyme